MPNPLSLDAFERAIRSLESALNQPKDEFVRDACIQRFEYTFELAWKSLKRYLDQNTNTGSFNLKDLFREAGRQNLIADVEAWFDYHTGRNLTVHTYQEVQAEATYELAKQFLPDAKALYRNLHDNLKA